MAISLGPSGLNINGTIVDGPEDLGAPTTFNSVGSYGFFYRTTQGISKAGDTVSGSHLRYNNYNANSGATLGSLYIDANTSRVTLGFSNQYIANPSGTWRVMGMISVSSTTHTGSAQSGSSSLTLFVRTA